MCTMAAWIADVSSVLPSPLAPKSFTLTIPPGGGAGTAVGGTWQLARAAARRTGIVDRMAGLVARFAFRSRVDDGACESRSSHEARRPLVGGDDGREAE